MATSLEERFSEFLTSLPASEAIDSLDFPQDPRQRRKADFLLAGRNVVVEIKTLTVDTSHKIEPAVEKHRNREEFPLFYGTADLRKVLSHLPDGEDVYRRIYLSITRSVEDAVRSAEEQISHTRHVLKLSDSAGVLVILNESVQLLNPTIVAHRVASLMRRERTGNSSSEKLDFVWLLFESHALREATDIPAFPIMLISGERSAQFPWFGTFQDDLVNQWAAFNNVAVIDSGNQTPNSLKFTATEELHSPIPTQLPRQEVWRRQYRSQPYMRHLSDAAVLEHGGKIIKRLMPYFLKGGPGYITEVVNPLLEEFTHFQEEASHRALDWRDIPKPYPLN
ncbi:MAG: hypothetical protein Q7S69_07220 [Nitrosomonadaceae bacterium]|nr:hypothetical protein [Nitrosomonadaceae bacterium]